MKITKRSPRTGRMNTRVINVTEEQIKDWQNGTLIQNAMPNISDDDREFLMTGLTPEDWDAMFSNPED